MGLLEDCFELWLFALDHEVEAYGCCEILSSKELAFSERILDAQTRRNFVTSKAVLRCIIASYGEWLPGDIDFLYNRHKKPFLKNNQAYSSIQFNLSHSSNYAVLAVSNNIMIGTDIEYFKRKKRQEEQIAKRYFSDHEIDLYHSGLNKELEFIKIWTRKEAFSKAMGMGLSYSNIKNLTVTSLNAKQEDIPLFKRQHHTVILPWRIHTFIYQNKYVVSTAIRKFPINVKVKLFQYYSDQHIGFQELFREKIG